MMCYVTSGVMSFWSSDYLTGQSDILMSFRSFCSSCEYDVTARISVPSREFDGNFATLPKNP